MTKPLRPYSRVYWQCVDDERFAHVWDDDRALAAWLRLLVAADMAWPASATLYHGIRPASLRTLVDAGLVDMQTAGRYRIHGLDKERLSRADDARSSANIRWHGRAEGLPSHTDDDYARSADALPSHPVSNAERMPSRDETRRDEQRRDENHAKHAENGEGRRVIGGLTAEQRALMAAHATLADRTASDRERAEATTTLGGIPAVPQPVHPTVVRPPGDDEDMERHRAIAADPDAPEWKRQAARDQLGVMGVSA